MTAARLLDQEVTVPEAICQVLEEAGIRFVFGMPGGRTSPIFNALSGYRATIRTVLVREEGLAAVMADVHGRLTGRPGVAMGQGAFMLANGGMGIIEGLLAGSPMLILSDLSDGFPFTQHGPYQAGTGDYGTWDARRTISGFTKETFVARDAVAAVQNTQLGIKHALAGQPGPVAVLYHSSVVTQRVGPDTVPRLYRTGSYLEGERPVPSETVLDAALALLRAARAPVIIAGNGVRISAAQEALMRLAERTDIPVATTASGKGVFPETHPMSLGVFGTFGRAAANAVVSAADLVIAVGTKLGPSDTASENPALLDPERQQFIQVDIEPRNAGWTYPVAAALVGDARRTLEAISGRIERSEGDSYGGAGRAAAAREAHGGFDEPEAQSLDPPVHPQRLIKALHEALPSNAIVACDAGENRLFMMHFFQTKAGMEYLQPSSVGGMGYAIPAALAAKLVHPARAVVAVCGDGGFGVGMNGMMTAVDESIPIVTVVFNNSMLGWVRHQQPVAVASEFARHDHAAIARAMGCAGYRVEHPEELAPALAQALAGGQPAVVDVITSPDLTFRDVTSPLAAYP